MARYFAHRSNAYLSVELTDAQVEAITAHDRAETAWYDEHGTYDGGPTWPEGCPTDVALPLEERTPDDAATLAVLSARQDFESANPGFKAPPPVSPAEAYRQELARCVAGAVPR